MTSNTVLSSASDDTKRLNPDLFPPNGRSTRTKTTTGRQTTATDILLHQLKVFGLPAPEMEYLFHPDRKWRFDLAWVNDGIAVEIDGGIWLQTKSGRSKGHAHPQRFIQDLEKLNEAILQGWRVFRFTPEMVKKGLAIAWLERAFAQIGNLADLEY